MTRHNCLMCALCCAACRRVAAELWLTRIVSQVAMCTAAGEPVTGAWS